MLVVNSKITGLSPAEYAACHNTSIPQIIQWLREDICILEAELNQYLSEDNKRIASFKTTAIVKKIDEIRKAIITLEGEMKRNRNV